MNKTDFESVNLQSDNIRMKALKNIKSRVGCWLNERWQTEIAIALPTIGQILGIEWIDLCNRQEKLIKRKGLKGRVCDWADTSHLTVCRIYPEIGARLLRHCLKEWPIEFEDKPNINERNNIPNVSIIIAIAGEDRLPQFQFCLKTLYAQSECSIEVIVVEQSWRQVINKYCPSWIRYYYAPSTSPSMPFNKSWAMNIGAKKAKAETLIFHDADILAPTRYLKTIIDLMDSGYEAARLPRLVFYLNRSESENLYEGGRIEDIKNIQEVVQNCRGISLAIQKRSYWEIGGHDEAFYGWGGEDDEMLSRVKTLKLYPGGFIPFVHLWHTFAINKTGDRNNQLLEKRLLISEEQRIKELRKINQGGDCPTVKWETA